MIVAYKLSPKTLQKTNKTQHTEKDPIRIERNSYLQNKKPTEKEDNL